MLKSSAWIFVALCAAALLPVSASGAPAKELTCEIGPVNKTYGKTQWLVYSCDDGRSLVVVTAEGSPAAPFFFMLTPSESGHALHGEGTGDKALTDAAQREIGKLSESDITAIIAETKAVKP